MVTSKVALWCCVALLSICTTAPARADTPPLDEEAIRALPHDVVESRLAGQHPLALYEYSSRLLREGDWDKAAFWFYAGQLRGRVLQAVTKDRSLGNVLGAYQASLGDTINRGLQKSPSTWVSLIDKVLEWDASNDNALTKYGEHREEYEQIRRGLSDLKGMVTNLSRPPAPPPTKTDLGHPVFVAPFEVKSEQAPFGTFWLGNATLAYSGAGGTHVWDIAGGKDEYQSGREITCASNASYPPSISAINTEPDSGRPGGFRVTGKLVGPWGQLQPNPEDLPMYPTSREQRLPSGTTIKQWPVVDSHTRCYARWLPDNDTPAHMAAAMRYARLFGGSVILDNPGWSAPEMLVRIFVQDRTTPIELPIRSCELDNVPWERFYYEHKKAYIAWAKFEGSCEKQPQYDKPRRYWWLFEDGRLEAGEVPSHKNTPFSAIHPGSDYVATAAGFIYAGYGSSRASRSLVLIREGQFFKLMEAASVSTEMRVSPNGCRVAFSVMEQARGGWRIYVVDLCQP